MTRLNSPQIDPKLVLPEWAPPLNPLADLGFHLVPSVVMILDILFFSPPWTIGTFPAIGLTSSIAVVYWFWVEECYRYNGFYPYPIFDEAGYYGRLGLFTMSAVTMWLGIWAMRGLHGALNGKEIPGRVKNE
jgi:FAR-17a/AIG1-like protein